VFDGAGAATSRMVHQQSGSLSVHETGVVNDRDGLLGGAGKRCPTNEWLPLDHGAGHFTGKELRDETMANVKGQLVPETGETGLQTKTVTPPRGQPAECGNPLRLESKRAYLRSKLGGTKEIKC